MPYRLQAGVIIEIEPNVVALESVLFLLPWRIDTCPHDPEMTLAIRGIRPTDLDIVGTRIDEHAIVAVRIVKAIGPHADEVAKRLASGGGTQQEMDRRRRQCCRRRIP